MTEPKRLQPALSDTPPGPVKAWAIVLGNEIWSTVLYPTREQAEMSARYYLDTTLDTRPLSIWAVTITPGHEAALPADVVRLVIAARQVAFGDPLPEHIKELDAASEAFADRVPWENIPEEDQNA